MCIFALLFHLSASMYSIMLNMFDFVRSQSKICSVLYHHFCVAHHQNFGNMPFLIFCHHTFKLLEMPDDFNT